MTAARTGRRALPTCAATLLGSAAAVHLLWATGSAWPARDRDDLADLVAGTQAFPGPVPCVAVAGVLTTAAALVAKDAGGTRARAARAALAVGLAVRGVAGVTGRTRALVPWTPTDRFARMDRRFYGPLCLVIAALVAAGLPAGARRAAARCI